MKRGNGGPVPSTANDDDAATALHRLRVVALGEGVAPVFAGRWLAAFGADVTAVEPVVGHWLRRYSPTGGTWQGPMGPLGTFLYAGASVIALDADREQDRAALSDLLAGADILLHDLTEDGLARWGLEERAPWADLPALIQVALTPFGTDGPYAGYAATSIVSLALGGYQFLTGEPGREPLMLPGFQPEYLTALYGVIAALAGVSRRHEEGSGCAVEISAMEALASLHQFTTSQWLYEGGIRTRHGNRWENLYPITMLPCRDGYITLSMPGPEMWERLCLMIERPDLPDDPRFATPALRHQNADALDAILLDWLNDRNMDELFRMAQEQWRLPVNPYYELDAVLRDPHYSARGFWVRSGGDDAGILHPGLPVVMSETAWRLQAGRPNPPAPFPRKEGGAWSVTTRNDPDRRGPRPSSRSSAVWRGTPFLAREGGAVSAANRVRSTTPLTSLRVLDFTRVWSGPLCTRILADLGAQVIKVEAPFPRNAPVRGTGSAGGAERPVAGMGKLGRNKLSVCVDLQLPAGRELVKRLAAESDLLVENFSARVMPNFGLGYDVLREVNPGLIMLSMSGYGATGPYRDYLCYGSATESMTGMTTLLGYPGEEPLNSAIAYPDAVAGLSGAAAVLTALVYRQRTGRGQFLDLSQIEPATAMFGEYFLAHQMTGRRPARTGNQHPYWAPHGTYRCRGEDEWVSLAVRSDEEWAAFCAVAGLVDLGRDRRYTTAEGRRAHRERVDAAIGAWAAERDKFEAMDLLQRAGIPAGAVLNAKELVENPHLAHRGFFVDAQAPEGGSFPMPGTPITIDGRKRQTWHAAAYRGEHNRVVLQEVLGLSDAEVESLIDAGAIVEAARAVT